MAKKTYLVKTPIDYAPDKQFVEGDSIELDDKTEAPQLLAVGAIEETNKKAAAK